MTVFLEDFSIATAFSGGAAVFTLADFTIVDDAQAGSPGIVDDAQAGSPEIQNDAE